MTDLSYLTIGFALGLRHAADADHLAAIATLASQRGARLDAIRHGVAWGCGHALTLLTLGGALLTIDSRLPATLQIAIDIAIGMMLVGLGGDAWRSARHQSAAIVAEAPSFRRLRFRPATAAAPPHGTQPSSRASGRAAMIGIVHGLAGAMTLVTLTAASEATVIARSGYLLLFAAGSIAGMAALSLLIATGIRWLAPAESGRAARLPIMVIGALNVMLGLWVIVSAVTGH